MNEPIHCVDCKFWDAPLGFDREDAVSAEFPYPDLSGVCLRSYGYSDIHPGDVFSMAAAEALVFVPQTQNLEGESIFLDGSPYNELDARRIGKNETKQQIVSWLSTNPFFSCNQAIDIGAECPEPCDHCIHTLAFEDV